jgi:hypothetical protein
VCGTAIRAISPGHCVEFHVIRSVPKGTYIVLWCRFSKREKVGLWHHHVVCTYLSLHFNFINSWLITYAITGSCNVVLFNFLQYSHVLWHDARKPEYRSHNRRSLLRSEYASNSRVTYVAVQRRCKHAFPTIERPYFLRCPCKVVIGKSIMEKNRVELRCASLSGYERGSRRIESSLLARNELYVCTRVGQRLALAPRPLMIYCASLFD